MVAVVAECPPHPVKAADVPTNGMTLGPPLAHGEERPWTLYAGNRPPTSTSPPLLQPGLDGQGGFRKDGDLLCTRMAVFYPLGMHFRCPAAVSYPSDPPP